MNLSVDPNLSSRIKAAWNKLTPDQQQQFSPAIQQGHLQAVAVAQSGKAPSVPAAPHHLMLAQCALADGSGGLANNLQDGTAQGVGPDGVIWGTGKYEQFDPGWAEAFAVFLETLAGSKHPFIAKPSVISVPDSVQIALAGDWSTGNWRSESSPAPSTKVAKQMAALGADLTIHLGDVYYAGTGDQEKENLVSLWPKGSVGSLALNSNHEMYSGANPFFQAISSPPFEIQKGCSYFALENTNWVVVGLDSAYFSPEHELFMNGSLGPEGGTQVMFLQSQVAKGKKIIVLTHHNGLAEDGSTTNDLWTQVMSGFAAGHGPALWYWGHAHAGVVYQPKGPNVLCRCCGHSALPWGHATQLDNNPNVLWYETRSANDPQIPLRVLNGFAVLYLDGPNIHEVFYDENGGVAWP